MTNSKCPPTVKHWYIPNTFSKMTVRWKLGYPRTVNDIAQTVR